MGICRQLASILEFLFERFGFETSGLCRTRFDAGYLWFFTSPSRKAFPCTVADQKIILEVHVKGRLVFHDSWTA